MGRMKHPAKDLGAWLKKRRQQQGVVLRVFAGQIEFSPVGPTDFDNACSTC